MCGVPVNRVDLWGLFSDGMGKGGNFFGHSDFSEFLRVFHQKS
jgi:hypothetical protein